MTISTIKSDLLKVDTTSFGGELASIIDIESGRECLWQGSPEYWKGRSPVLFPIVGALNGSTLRQGGNEYTMGQHGFARASEFEIVRHTQEEILYRLESSEKSLTLYPYAFALEIGYKVVGRTIEVSFRVVNPSDEVIYFQIGAHPGFNYFDYDPSAQVQGYFEYDDTKGKGEILSGIINTQGLLIEEQKLMPLSNRRMEITKDLFNDGALIIENSQCSEISLLDQKGEAYVRVSFDAPVVGLWSISKESYAPYACIEPWYGRCDKINYEGEFAAKDWMQSLQGGATFEKGYSIWIGK